MCTPMLFLLIFIEQTSCYSSSEEESYLDDEKLQYNSELEYLVSGKNFEEVELMFFSFDFFCRQNKDCLMLQQLSKNFNQLVLLSLQLM